MKAARRKFTGKVRRGLYILATTDAAAVLNAAAEREEVGLTARQISDANAAYRWILGELRVRGEAPYAPKK